MPCDKHTHVPWPRSGTHRLLIDSCENQCGWCNYKNPQANNLRVHAWRHIKNPQDESLKGIVIAACKAGRRRVAVNLPADPDSSADRLPSQDGKAPADELTRLERSEAALQKLEESYREAVDECLALRYKNAILEKILRDKGIDAESELHANIEIGSHRQERHVESHTLERPKGVFVSSTAPQPSNDNESELNHLSDSTKRLTLKVALLHELLNTFIYREAILGRATPFDILKMKDACALLPADPVYTVNLQGLFCNIGTKGLKLPKDQVAEDEFKNQDHLVRILEGLHQVLTGEVDFYTCTYFHYSDSDETDGEDSTAIGHSPQSHTSMERSETIHSSTQHDRQILDISPSELPQPESSSWQGNGRSMINFEIQSYLHERSPLSMTPPDPLDPLTESRPQPLEPSVDWCSYDGGSSLNATRSFGGKIDASRSMVALSKTIPSTKPTLQPQIREIQPAETRAQGHLDVASGSRTSQAVIESSQPFVFAYGQSPPPTADKIWYQCRVPECNYSGPFVRSGNLRYHIGRLGEAHYDELRRDGKFWPNFPLNKSCQLGGNEGSSDLMRW